MKKLISIILAASLVFQLLLFGNWSFAHAQEMTCPPHDPVLIDVRPGEEPNTINLSARGLLPVALLTTSDFDASLFMPEMEHVHLSDADVPMEMGCVGANPVRWKLDDANGDDLADLVFFFRIQDLNLSMDSTAARLMAHGAYGSGVIHIQGTDSVVIRP